MNDQFRSKYAGMTLNERLVDAQIEQEFARAVQNADRKRLRELLITVEISPSEADQTAETILASPAKYGY